MEEKVAAADERSERRRPPVPTAVPWLVIPHGKGGNKDQAFYNLWEPNNKTCRKCIPELTRKSYWQSPSHQGWLVIFCHEDEDDDSRLDPYSNSNWKFGDCFLWNPVSLQIIQLPSLLHWLNNKSHQYYIIDCVLSSPPVSTNLDSMVFFLFASDKSPEYVLVFCRPGEGKQWRKHEFYGIENSTSPESLICFKGQLYLMCGDSQYLKVENFGSTDDDSLSIRSFKVTEETTPFMSIGGFYSRSSTYYVESGDELFKIVINFDQRGFHEQVLQINVMRMDFSLMVWKNVKSLGDHVLFLGQNTTASCSAVVLGLTRGCVYYTRPKDKTLYTFDLEDRNTFVSLPCTKLPTPWLSPRWMIIPTTFSVAYGRRRTECMLGNDEEEVNMIEAKENKTNINNNNDEKEDDHGQMENGGKLEKATSFGILNDDILELIANHLHPVDYIHFRAVCKANRSAISVMNWRASSTGIIQTTLLSPWLVFSTDDDAIFNFVDPMHSNEKYLMNLPELLLGATIRFSKGGWLLMSKGKYTLFFYNPFTRATIQLPTLPDDCCYTFSGISFSSLPTSSDCVVFAISKFINDEVLILVIARGDARWIYGTAPNTNLPANENYIEFEPCLNNPVFYDGAFYCLDWKGSLGVFNLEDDEFCWKVLSKPQRPCNSIYRCFLMECEGKLLSVFLGHMGKWVRIFRLDFSEMVWVKVESLGKYMLFISDTSCFSAIAQNNRMENTIYFPRLHGEGILFYSLDTGRYHSLDQSGYSAQDFYDTKELYCSWIEPKWSQTTVQELDWRIIN